MNELQVLMYVAYAFLFVGTGYRAYRMAKMPVHLRWDLYPIPHEKGRGRYGGSYFEEIDWWTKPAQVSVRSELGEMAREIFFIQSMYHNNRRLWLFSFPFHLGLYLLVAFVLLIFLGAILVATGIPVSAEGGLLVGSLYYVTIALGICGSVLGTAGALGLLVSRATRVDLRRTSVRGDYFNLVLLLAVFVSGLLAWRSEPTYTESRLFISHLISFQAAAPVPSALVTHLVLAAVFMIYLPFTHMTHFVGKYFAYHKVRWEDSPNVRGSTLEKRINEALGYTLTWAAPHIKTGGTWAEAATEESTKNEQAQ